MDTAAAPTLDGELLEPPDPAPRGRGRRRSAALAAVLITAGAAAAAGLLSRGASHHRSGGGVPPGDTTAAVERRTLTESSTVDGTLGYGGAQNVYNRLAGTYTWLPSAGTVIARGGTLYRLDEKPVVLMYGAVPAYRALKRGLSGSDVEQLNTNLTALGFDPYGAITATRSFDAGTEAAVRRWQSADGLPVTGAVPLGRVVFASGSRRVTAVDVSLGQDPPAAEEHPAAAAPAATTPTPTTPTPNTPTPTPTTPTPTPTPTTPAPTVPAKTPTASAPATPVPAKTTPATPGKRSPAPKNRARKHPVSKSKAPSKASSPSESTPSSPSSSGKENEHAAAGGGELVMSVTPTAQLVTVQLKAEQQTLARVGERAPVMLPNGRSVTGHVVSVGTVATAAKENEKGGSNEKGEGESATIPVTLALDHPVARLDKAPVSVELVKSIRRNVLCVPATALTATAGGGYAVQAVEAARVTPVAVTPGMFAGGYVEIEGGGVHEGLTVLVPR